MKQLLFILIFFIVICLNVETSEAWREPEGPPNPEITVLDSSTFAIRFMSHNYLLKVENDRFVIKDFKNIYRTGGKVGPTAGYVLDFKRLNIERK